VQADVAAGQGELTLADLLAPGTCLELRQAAALVGLGAVPRAESVRVLDGRQIRHRLENLTGAGLNLKTISMHIPVRIVVRRAGATKSCAEIAQFVTGSAALDMAGASGLWQENFDCAAARGLPEETPLELRKTAWNAPLQRWEFVLRCVRPEDCVPFMIWTSAEKASSTRLAYGRSDAVRRLSFLEESSTPGQPEAAVADESRIQWLVKRGQAATLTWDQAGIRVVLPVTCLDAGGLGQFVRVRFKNGSRILRAEVVGEGTLRAAP
jgi:hypothetical protein